jgi:uncharacterized alkaline shock family protein YloU
MANERENTNYTIYENAALGDVRIADEVVAIIAGIAAMDVEGVVSMAGNSKSLQKEIISRFGNKVLSKGVNIHMEEGCVEAELSVILDYGCVIPDVTAAIQEKVKSAIETMTGLTVKSVSVLVADVKLEDE